MPLEIEEIPTEVLSVLPPEQKPKTRLVGAGILVLGLAMAYGAIWLPLEAARAHNVDLHYSNTTQLIATFLTSIGLSCVVMGSRLYRERNHFSQKLNERAWVVFLASLAASYVVNQWLKLELAKYGYKV